MLYHQSLRLENFTAFSEAEFEFVPGINVFIGENGTGKTHMMKVLFWSSGNHPESELDPLNILTFRKIFQATTKETIRHKSDKSRAYGTYGDKYWNILIPKDQPIVFVKKLEIEPNPKPVFIPAIDMMSHTKRFISTFDEYEIDFDLTHRDIVSKLLSPERRDADSQGSQIQRLLSEILGGEVSEEGERFYLSTPGGKLPMPLVAEGLRKIATLQQLIRNGWLQPGSTLFWDEPEANLSPIVRDELVRALLLLARSGVQIFLATHSYIILKELDLQKEEGDTVRFFALERHPDGTKVHPADDYVLLQPNKIAEQFDSIYDRELTRATGRKRAK